MKWFLTLLTLVALPAHADPQCRTMEKEEFLKFTQMQKTRMDASCGAFFCDPSQPGCATAFTVCYTDTDEGSVVRRDVSCQAVQP
jgi:hypothetical protein